MEVVLETVQRICLEILVDLFDYGLLFGLVVFLSACHSEEYLNSAIVTCKECIDVNFILLNVISDCNSRLCALMYPHPIPDMMEAPIREQMVTVLPA